MFLIKKIGVKISMCMSSTNLVYRYGSGVEG